MRKMLIAAAGLLCLTARGADAQTFEQQVEQISRKTSAAAGEMRQNLAAAQERPRGPAAWNPLDALDEAKVGLAAKFVAIASAAPVEFDMGSPADEAGRAEDEDQHRVKLTQGFELQATEVTQLQYFLVRLRNPSTFRKAEDCDKDNFKPLYGRTLCVNHPAETITWDDAQEFIKELNQIQKRCVYRLPTEAEWEYAARGGTTSAYSFGSNANDELIDYAWYRKNSDDRTRAVARKKANPLGLYDMHGNVSEWVQDWGDEYPSAKVTDPAGPEAGSFRAFRGGSLLDPASRLRCAYRSGAEPDFSSQSLGLRLARACQ